MTPAAPSYLISGMLNEPLRSLLRPVEPAMQKLLAIDYLRRIYTPQAGPGAVLEHLDIRIGIDPEDLDNIPRFGAAIIVSNHPFGLLEAAALAAELPKLRPDIRFLANSLLMEIPGMRGRCIFVNAFGNPGDIGRNAGALRDCLAHLKSGGSLAVFPAGEVAHFDWKAGAVVDPAWNPAVARLAQIAGVPVVPIFFRGSNGLTFQLAGAIHPRLRTFGLPLELVNKRGRRVHARIGRPVAPELLRSLPPGDAAEYLRCRTYALETKADKAPAARAVRRRPIAAPTPKELVGHEIRALPEERKLAESGEFEVYSAQPDEIPAALREIGRLREITFRQVGEGSGKALDLDRFDRHYSHLILWNRSGRRIAGAYRLCASPDVLPRFGVNGFYTRSLFRYGPQLLDELGPALELGRSFVCPEYQKQYAPLLLLWKAIARYAAKRPDCATLFGAVSISNSYHAVSRHLIVRFLEAHRWSRSAARVTPRAPYRPDLRLLHRSRFPQQPPQDLDALSSLIADLESDGKGIPVLLRHYLKTGGRVLAVNVDRRFSDALDALIVVDLRKAPPAFLDRYMGHEQAAAFRAWHAARA